ncbi:hypothetical protein C7121_00790 [Paenibacillus glucanolyticus]|nr:hypothetical protein A3958_14425 [Paenibacillus glucanolyticus]AVV54786.1 hypothetical protein C7121_00790 [Paenibacillus glucanolyticus]
MVMGVGVGTFNSPGSTIILRGFVMVMMVMGTINSPGSTIIPGVCDGYDGYDCCGHAALGANGQRIRYFAKKVLLLRLTDMRCVICDMSR